MSSFFKGIFVLAVVAFLGECIEFLVNMVLAKELGGVGMGLYMSILPVVFFVVVLASMELTVSISKYIAEKEEKYHASMLRHGIRFSAFFTIVLTIVTICVLPIIPVFNQYHPFIRLLVVILIPITSFSSIARGYFMGVQQMGKIAVANFTRKFAQLILLVFIFRFFQFDLETSILIALSTFVGSEIVVLLYLLQQFYVQMKKMKNKGHIRLSGKNVRKSLLAVSLPTTGMRISHSIAHAIQPFLIKAALMKAGLTGTVALEHFGIVSGVAFSIGFFPAFIAHSFSTVLIPTVSEAYAQKDYVKLQKLLQQVMFMTFIYGIPAILAFHYFAQPLTHLFFKSAFAPLYLQLLWPYFLFHYFVIPLQAFLIGIGLITDSLIHYIWATIVMFVIMYILGSNPHYQMIGIILAMNTSSLLLMLLHYVTICKKIGVSLILRKPYKQSY